MKTIQEREDNNTAVLHTPFKQARPEYRMTVSDEIEGDDFIIFVPNNIESVPSDVTINTGEYTWHCYLVSATLAKVYMEVGSKHRSRQEMYKCRYRKY